MHKRKIWQIVAWVLFGTAAIAFVVGQCVHYQAGANADLASDLLLAKYLAEGRGFILSDQWFYSTEVHFIHNQLIFTPLFWLFGDNWFLVQVGGSVIMNGLMLAALWYLLKSMRADRLFPWLGTLLLLPLGYEYGHFISFSGAYTVYIAMAMLILGMVIWALRAKTKRTRYALIAGAAVLTLLDSVGGIRHLVTLAAPLFGGAVLFWLFNLRSERRGTAQLLFWSALICLTAALIGLFINQQLANVLHFDPHYKTFHFFPDFFTARFDWRALFNRWSSFVRVFGFELEPGENLLLRVLLNCIALDYLGFYLFTTVAILVRQKRYSAGTVLLTWFTLLGMLMLMAVVTLTDIEYYVRFYLPAAVFCLPVCALWLAGNLRLFSQFRQFMAKLTWGVMLVFASIYYVQFYACHNWVWCRVPSDELYMVTQKLVADGYHAGYSSFYSYNVITQFSRGKIEMYGFQNLVTADFDDLYLWLQLVEHADQRPTGKVFFLVDAEIGESVLPIPHQLRQAAADHLLDYGSERYLIFGFDSVQELLDCGIYHSKPLAAAQNLVGVAGNC